MTERVTFTAPVTADAGRRIIAGRAVPWDQVGATSAGRTRFAAGSITWDTERPPRLVREHDRTAVLGAAQVLADTGDGLRGTWKIAETTAGNDALVEAAEHLRDGLSVGVIVEASDLDEDGVLVVTAGRLDHVGLVVDPAYGDGARVDHVAASTPEPTPDPDPEPTNQQEAATVDPEQTETVEATGPDPDTEQLAAAAAEPTVHTAAHVQVGADRQVEALTAGAFIKHSVLAQTYGNAEDLRMVKAALAEDASGSLTGLVPEGRTTDLIAIIDAGRPYFDALVQRPLPDQGLKITTPKLTQKPLADVIAEGVDVGTGGGSQQVIVTDDETTVETIKQANAVSVEVIERSSPAYLDELLTLYAEAFAVRQNTYVRAALVAAASASTATVGSSYNQMFAKGKADSLGVRRKSPDRIGIALNIYEALEGEEDADGRPLWGGIAQQNAPGDVAYERGTIKRTPSFVDVDSADDLALAFPSDAAYVYSSPRTQVRAMQVGTMQWEVGVYGFIAVQDRFPTAIRSMTIAAV